MKYVVIYLVFLIPLYQLTGTDIKKVERGEARNDYREGYNDGVIAGEQEGQQLWQVLGCIGGGAGAFLGCLSIGYTYPCFESTNEGSCLFDPDEGGIDPYLYVTVSGCVGGMLTGGSIALMAGRAGDSPAMLIGHSPEYTQGYIDGFRNITKRKKGEAALIGAVIGTMSSTVFMLLMMSGTFYD
ncbi:hypothetical protein A2Y85_01855 [candidate division WOR-3 bacterium RBG_13_43_14]|uniref:Uncharacterized protein n=1 Tax=candidate division WOR-3 bacterium RBG_13_43_14 TaxID=1802590 RepID=A0A1F4UAB3_UNCW3|nr:MAG: hypothetical protein A2Y85_01855 [candidate division WOR-3 bacterium RBG_13_43_14]